MALVEIGAAAGLNLVADRLPAPWTDLSGARLDVARAPNVTARVGIDRHPLPLRAADDESVAWMRACIWAGDTERLERFDAAVKAFRTDPPELVTGSALDAPTVLERAGATDVVLAFQTIVRDYFDPETDLAYEAGMRAWLAGRPRGSAAWCELEIVDHARVDDAHPAALVAHVSDGCGGVLDLPLARTSYHPKDLVVDRAAVARFVAAMR